MFFRRKATTRLTLYASHHLPCFPPLIEYKTYMKPLCIFWLKLQKPWNFPTTQGWESLCCAWKQSASISRSFNPLEKNGMRKSSNWIIFSPQVGLHYFRNHHHLINRKNQRNGTLVVCSIVILRIPVIFFSGQETIPFTTKTPRHQRFSVSCLMASFHQASAGANSMSGGYQPQLQLQLSRGPATIFTRFFTTRSAPPLCRELPVKCNKKN